MSDTVQANKGAVSALADTDLVMCVGFGGSYRPVSYADLAKAIRETISIGGRNLLLASGTEISKSQYNIGKYNYSELPKVGDRLLITLWGELGADRVRFEAYNGNGYPERGKVNLTKVDDGVFQGVLEIKQDPGAYPFVQVYHAPQSATSNSIIHRIKAEYGNIATDWSPAPEDIASGAWLWGGDNFISLNKLQFRRFGVAGRRAA